MSLVFLNDFLYQRSAFNQIFVLCKPHRLVKYFFIKSVTAFKYFIYKFTLVKAIEGWYLIKQPGFSVWQHSLVGVFFHRKYN